MDWRDLKVGDILHEWNRCTFNVGPRGGVKEHHVTWEITSIKTWKRDPDRFDITVHRGLKGWDHVTSQPALNRLLCLENACPAHIQSELHATQLAHG